MRLGGSASQMRSSLGLVEWESTSGLSRDMVSFLRVTTYKIHKSRKLTWPSQISL